MLPVFYQGGVSKFSSPYVAIIMMVSKNLVSSLGISLGYLRSGFYFRILVAFGLDVE